MSGARAIAAEAIAALDTGRQIGSFSARDPAFDLAVAYKVAAAIRQIRASRGERPVGRKIGFTNKAMWAAHGVHAPIWDCLRPPLPSD